MIRVCEIYKQIFNFYQSFHGAFPPRSELATKNRDIFYLATHASSTAESEQINDTDQGDRGEIGKLVKKEEMRVGEVKNFSSRFSLCCFVPPQSFLAGPPYTERFG